MQQLDLGRADLRRGGVGGRARLRHAVARGVEVGARVRDARLEVGGVEPHQRRRPSRTRWFSSTSTSRTWPGDARREEDHVPLDEGVVGALAAAQHRANQ